jgi:hypothetical protein
MGMGRGELVLIGVVLATLGYALAVPIVGIVRAVGRKYRGQRSTGAVVWSSINVGLFGLGTVAGFAAGPLAPAAPFIGLALNGVWLAFALGANRAASRARAVV